MEQLGEVKAINNLQRVVYHELMTDMSLQWILRGPKHPLSRGCIKCVVFGGRANMMTVVCSHSRSVCTIMRVSIHEKKNGTCQQSVFQKRELNQALNNSWSIHPFLDRPYRVPRTSPTVSSGFNLFLSHITIGGRQ